MVTALIAGGLLAMTPSQQAKSDFEKRANDWRNGAVVYQVFVDRFVPPTNIAAKQSLYQTPLKPWTELPKARFDEKTKSYPHVYDFWGGDLNGLSTKLDYIQQLGADVVYLNPIFTSPSNHKYDTTDYLQIDPQLGTMSDFKSLLKQVHAKKMRLMLDGVFNHIGDQSPIFLEAKTNPKSVRHDWFFIGNEYEKGYRGWAGVSSMPALKLENPEVRDYLWKSKTSVVNHYLKLGIDGWRLDVAFELGPDYLSELTKSAHSTRKGSAVIGEISGYPAEWNGAVDGVFNFHSINLGIEMLNGNVSGGQVGQMYDDLVADAGIESLLKAWLITDNHDTPRLSSVVKDSETRHLVKVLQMTLPGSPCLYYGTELGLPGAGDPECRAPMSWDKVTDANPDYASTKNLLKLRKAMPALKYGDYKSLRTDKLLAFARTTDRLQDTVIVVMNPTTKSVKESFASRVGRIMSWGEMVDVMTGKKYRSITGMLNLELPAKSAMILVPSTDPFGGYSPYQRILDSDG